MKVTCPNCKKTYDTELERLPNGELPEGKPYQREQLQTGICSDECWTEFLGPEE